MSINPPAPAINILIIEDDRAFSRLLETGLQTLGQTNLTAVESAEEALNIVERERPDLILVDRVLPRRSGLEFIQEAAKDPNGTAFTVLMSALGEHHHIIEALEAGADDYFIKQPGIDVLQNRLRVFVHQAEQKKKAKDAQFIQRNLQRIAGNLPGLIFQLIRKKGEAPRFTFVSGRVEEMLDICRTRFTPDTFQSMMGSQSAGALRNAMEEGARTLTPCSWEGPVTTPKGRTVWVRIEALPELRDEHQVIWDGLALDVTESVEASKQLAESESRFARLADTAPVMIWMMEDTAPDDQFLNQALVDFTGYHGPPKREKFLRRCTAPEDTERLLMAWRRVQQSKSPTTLEYRLRRADGVMRWVVEEAMPWKDAEGNLKGVFGVVVDITNQRQTENLSADARHVLELLIAGKGPHKSMRQIFGLIERQFPECAAGVLSWESQRLRVLSGSSLPQPLKAVLQERQFAESVQGVINVSLHSPRGFFEDFSRSGPWSDLSILASSLGFSDACGVFLEHEWTESNSHLLVMFFRRPLERSDHTLELLLHIQRLFTIVLEYDQMQTKLVRQANYDALTGLPNRYFLQEELERRLSESDKEKCQLALLFIDLDHFKKLNDTYGHSYGDEVLRIIAQRLQRTFTRDNHFVARIGGDEFVVVLSGVENQDQVKKLIGEINTEISKGIPVDHGMEDVKASIGVALYPAHGDSVETLQRNADIAMYSAKERGRAQFRFYAPELHTLVKNRLHLERQLAMALQRNEMEVHYQPLVDLTSGLVIAGEALMRWENIEIGKVQPPDFIKAAEETNLMDDLNNFLLSQVSRDLREWQDTLPKDFRISINLSPRLFLTERFVQTFVDLIDAHEIRYNRLTVELTEDALIEDIPRAQKHIRDLAELDIHTSLDDFGKGHSTLSQLCQLPVAHFKIDKEFLQEDKDFPDITLKRRSVLELALEFARRNKLPVVVEGIEEADHLEIIGSQALSYGQGFLFSPAVERGKFKEMLHRRFPVKTIR